LTIFCPDNAAAAQQAQNSNAAQQAQLTAELEAGVEAEPF
jgi:hypothetical protein